MTTSPSTADPLAAGLPDVAALERLANQFFREVSGSSPSPGGLAAPAGVPAAPALPATPSVPTPSFGGHRVPGLPGIAGLPSVPGIPVDGDLKALLGAPRPSTPQLPGFSAEGVTDLDPRTSVPAAPRPGDLTRGPLVAPVPFPAERIRQQFPILSERVNGKRLVWLDNAATTQKPQVVIDRLVKFYQTENSNIHRAAHALAARATDAYEAARESVRRFIGAASTDEIVFVRGATEGINLIAKSWGAANLKAGDEILVSHLEHHANIVPWQQLAKSNGAVLKVIPVTDDGALDLSALAKLLNPKVKLVSVTQVANAIGTVVPVAEVTALAHAVGARVLVDGAQSVSHMPVNVQAIGCDWFVFSGHKVYGPTGIGAVYGQKEVLEASPPWQGGGNMISDVTFEHTQYHGAPARFEAGTGNIADAVGLGAALDWLSEFGMPNVAAYEHQLIAYAEPRLAAIKGLKIIGHPPERAGALSFILDGFSTTEVGSALDKDGIAVRSGHHCAQPILRRFGLEASVRPSFAIYTTCADIDALVASVTKLVATRR